MNPPASICKGLVTYEVQAGQSKALSAVHRPFSGQVKSMLCTQQSLCSNREAQRSIWWWNRCPLSLSFAPNSTTHYVYCRGKELVPKAQEIMQRWWNTIYSSADGMFRARHGETSLCRKNLVSSFRRLDHFNIRIVIVWGVDLWINLIEPSGNRPFTYVPRVKQLAPTWF